MLRSIIRPTILWPIPFFKTRPYLRSPSSLETKANLDWSLHETFLTSLSVDDLDIRPSSIPGHSLAYWTLIRLRQRSLSSFKLCVHQVQTSPLVSGEVI